MDGAGGLNCLLIQYIGGLNIIIRGNLRKKKNLQIIRELSSESTPEM
jgi:hypothetical protein